MKTSVYTKLVFLTIALITLHPSLITPCKAQSQVFYGMTFHGGTDSVGAIIKFDPANNSESVVWNFSKKGGDGQSPLGSLTYNVNNGLFYGMTVAGGSNNVGTIISFDPATNKDSVVWNFKGDTSDGEVPYGNLTYDPVNQSFYALTYGGGPNAPNENNGGGTIIRFDPANDSEMVVWDLGAGTDGKIPQGDLVYDSINGLFYGMTNFGGIYGLHVGLGFGYGTIVSFDPVANKDSVVWSFGNGKDGVSPSGTLVYYPAKGLFYGMTPYGGSNDTLSSGDGTIFSFDPATNSETVLWNFGSGTDGTRPSGDLVYNAKNGLFYATTLNGGNNNNGTIISFDPTTNTESVVWRFAGGTDGDRPNGNLTYDAGKGLFYGTTTKGGSNVVNNVGSGTIFSFNPANNSENVVWSFGGGTDGFTPMGSLALYPPLSSTGINSISNTAASVSVYPNPTNGKLTITGLNKGQIVEVYNYLGQKVSSLIAADNLQQLDISAQLNGVYIVRVFNSDGTAVGQKKVMKSN